MLKISEFSRLSRVTVKTLRYYDEIGLLPPAEVDQWTNYRYYSAEQLPRLRRIVMLKGMGFSLVEIGRILNDNLAADQIAAIAQLKRADLAQQLDEQQMQLSQLDFWLEQLNQEQKMPDYTVSTKEVTSLTAAYQRKNVPSPEDIPAHFERMFGQLFSYAGRHNAIGSPAFAEYYDEEHTDKNIDLAAAVTLTKRIPNSKEVEIRDLPSGMVAFTTHVGSYQLMNQAYAAVLEWIHNNEYKVIGPARELYIVANPDGDQADCVTEIQFFVEKI